MDNFNIIQSFWSKPFLFSLNNKSVKIGNWLSNEMFFISHALSILRLKEYYNNITLITDDIGAKILIDILGFPYDHVDLSLNQINKYNPNLWALGKIKSYEIQTKPFVHVDNDIFIWKKFDIDFLEKPLFCQSLDPYQGYKIITEQIRDNNFYYPKEMDKYINNRTHLDNIGGGNAGIIGGDNLVFFQKYTSLAFDIVNNNYSKLDKVSLNIFNIFFEQALFYCLSISEKCYIETLYKNSETVNDMINIKDVPNTFYIHPVSEMKKNIAINEFVYLMFKENHPIYFEKIQKIIKEKSYEIF